MAVPLKSRYALPPVKCSAIVKRTGKQCRLWAIPGATVCASHGGAAPQVKRKAAARVTAATVQAAAGRLPALLDEQPRMPWEVILDAGHTVDAVARDLLTQVREAGPNATPEQLDRLIAAYRLSHSMSEAAIRLGLVRLVVKRQEHEVAVTRAVLLGVLDALLANLGASDESALRLWMIRSYQASLSAPLIQRPRPLDEHPDRASKAAERLDDVARDAATSVPWAVRPPLPVVSLRPRPRGPVSPRTCPNRWPTFTR